jgi:hypothetical protein
MVNLPIIFRLPAMSIMKHITGAAVIPLITAAHTRAWIGSIFEKLSRFRVIPGDWSDT